MDKTENLAQDMLTAGNEHFQIVSQPQRVVFWLAGSNGECELMSPGWADLTGQPVEQSLHSGWLQKIAPSDRARVNSAVRSAVATEHGFFLHYEVLRHDGKLRRVLHDATVRRLPSGQFSGLIATITDESDQAAGEIALERSAQQVYHFLDNVPLAALALDFNGRLVHANQVLATQIGQSIADLIGSDWLALVSPGDADIVRRLINGSTPPSALPSELEYQLSTPLGIELYRWHLTLIRDSDGHPVSIAMMGSDITQWRRVGNRLRLSEKIFEGSMEAMVITDADNRIISINPSFTRLTGYSRDEVIGENPRILQSGKHEPVFYKQMWDSLNQLDYWRGDIWDRRKDGTQYPKFLAITSIRDAAGQVVNYSAIFYDITERKALEEEMDYLAHHDPLTGLPNRMLLQDRLEQAISLAERQKQHFALLFIDLDGFKLVNDCHGHAVGDVLLREVGQRLLAVIRGMDTAARLGGDEFVVILTDIKDRSNAARVAEKIIESLSVPYDLGERVSEPVIVSASIGVSIYPNDELVANELLRSADAAMYEAKRAGKSRVIFHGNVGQPLRDAPCAQ